MASSLSSSMREKILSDRNGSKPIIPSESLNYFFLRIPLSANFSNLSNKYIVPRLNHENLFFIEEVFFRELFYLHLREIDWQHGDSSYIGSSTDGDHDASWLVKLIYSY